MVNCWDPLTHNGEGNQQGSIQVKQKKKIYHGRDPKHPQFPHGELRGHKAGCRCLECKRAKAVYNLKQKGVGNPAYQKLFGMKPDHPDYPHGTRRGYRYCNCDACRKANNEYKKPLNLVRVRNSEKLRKERSEYSKAYQQTEIGHASKRAAHAKRRALKKAATVCALADMELLKLIYLHCPEGYHVDHIIPLSKGGLHHPTNLQYLPAIINMQKSANENYDYLEHVIRWQDNLNEPSSTIPNGSTPKRVEKPRILMG